MEGDRGDRLTGDLLPQRWGVEHECGRAGHLDRVRSRGQERGRPLGCLRRIRSGRERRRVTGTSRPAVATTTAGGAHITLADSEPLASWTRMPTAIGTLWVTLVTHGGGDRIALSRVDGDELIDIER